MDIAVLGIDLGKSSCSVVGLDGSGKVIVRRRLQRKTIVTLTAKLSPCIVAMEACCGAHHLGRVLAAQGHTIRLCRLNMCGLTLRPRRTMTAMRKRGSSYPANHAFCRA